MRIVLISCTIISQSRWNNMLDAPISSINLKKKEKKEGDLLRHWLPSGYIKNGDRRRQRPFHQTRNLSMRKPSLLILLLLLLGPDSIDSVLSSWSERSKREKYVDVELSSRWREWRKWTRRALTATVRMIRVATVESIFKCAHI